jgi:diguanylate cyclase (GGDEF)-like protein/PAS domain S-box-containing protein
LQIYNLHYQNQQILQNFIDEKHISKHKNILIQIFSGISNTKEAVKLSRFLKDKLPDANIIGTSSAGEILDGVMYEQSILISFCIFEKTTIKSKLYNLEEKFDISSISKDILQDNTKALILFSDGLKSNAQELLKQLHDIAPDIIIAGGRAADFIKFEKTYVFDEDKAYENGFIIASLNSDKLIVNSNYMLNWNPLGKTMIVTKADGNIVYEVDNIPIKELYKKYLGEDIANNLPSAGTEFPFITIKDGIKVARAPIACLEDGSLLFGANLHIGQKVQFSYGNIEHIKGSIDINYKKFNTYHAQAIFIYSCSGRKTLMGKELEAELKMLSDIAPAAGFFTFGEYYHSNKINEVLNITTTFLTLSEEKQDIKEEKPQIVSNDQNRILKALCHLTDVTTREIESKNRELEYLNNLLSDTVLYSTSDLKGNILSVSRALAKHTLYNEHQLVGKNHNIFRHEDTIDSFYDDMWNTLNNDKPFIGEIKNTKSDGSPFWLKITIDSMYNEDGEKIGYSSYREDITDKKMLEYVASHDPLTTLYNRSEFVKILNKTIKSAQRYNTSFGFIILDIDYFKKINDTFGHQIGDEILIKLSNILQSNLRDDDFLARWGGEEFVIITNHTKMQDLELVAKKLQDAIKKGSFEPLKKLTISLGLSVYNKKDTKDTIVKRADDALYKAKENGRDRYEIAL